MKRQYPISTLVYNCLYPHPTPSDPPDFATHLVRNLITEVRVETQRFYGSLDTIEAKYPGLNYSHPPHRKRLARFPHHKRLFDAFDRLGLTEFEISMLCRWEGTLWARQRYERDEGVKVVDTTGSEIKSWAEARRALQRDAEAAAAKRSYVSAHGGSGLSSSSASNGSLRDSRRSNGIKVKTDIEVEIEEVGASSSSSSSSTRNRSSGAHPTSSTSTRATRQSTNTYTPPPRNPNVSLIASPRGIIDFSNTNRRATIRSSNSSSSSSSTTTITTTPAIRHPNANTNTNTTTPLRTSRIPSNTSTASSAAANTAPSFAQSINSLSADATPGLLAPSPDADNSSSSEESSARSPATPEPNEAQIAVAMDLSDPYMKEMAEADMGEATPSEPDAGGAGV